MADPIYGGPDTARSAYNQASSTAPAVSSTDVTLDVFAKDVANGSEQARLALAQKLKDAGLWKGKISSKFDLKYYSVLVKLEEQYQGQIALDKLIGAKTPTNRYDVLTSIIANEDTGGDGPKSIKDTYVTSASQTAKLLNKVAVDLLERNLTKAEQAKYLKIINAAQRKQPSTTTSGKGFRTTLGGVDEEQLITEELQATSEAKNVRTSDAYALMMKEFGGLR